MSTRGTKRRTTVQKRQRKLAEQPRWHQRDAVVVFVLLAVTLAVFLPTCFSEFVSWDDNLNVSKNALLNPPTMAKVAYFWKRPFLDLYVPVTYTLWAALALAGRLPTPDSNGIQLNPFIFHAANLLVHFSAVLCVYALLRRIVKAPWPAAAGALLFAIHPLQVEAVAWVTGMKDVLSGALSLAALWQYVCFAQFAEQAKKRWAHYVAAIVLFVIAILAKPSAVVVPAVALVLDLWVLHRPWKKVVPAVFPLAVLSAGWMVLSVKFQTVAAPADARHVLLRPLIAADALAFYLHKMVFPLWLGFHYDRAPMTVISHGLVYYTWIAPVAVLAAAIAFRKKAPWLLPALAFFVVGVGPVLGLVPFSFQRYATVADRYVYLAMFGPAFALAMGMAARKRRDGEEVRRRASTPGGLVICVIVILALFGVRSFFQSLVWENNASLFANAIKVNPNSAAAYDGMAGVLATDPVPGETVDAARARLNQARDYAERAVHLAPGNPDAYITLGTIYHKLEELPSASDLGLRDDAIEAFRKAVRAAPDKPEGLDVLGGALAQRAHDEQSKNPAQAKDDRAEAKQYLQRAIAINPSLAQAHLSLGLLLKEENFPDQALEEIRLSVGLDGGDPMARIYYGMLLFEKDPAYLQQALAQLEVARKINPTLPLLRNAYQEIRSARPSH